MNSALTQAGQAMAKLRDNVQQVIIGQAQVIEEVLIALFAGGHVLIEGAPGLGKTLLVETLAKSVSGQFQRIQFTPDLLPADVTGSMIYDPASQRFKLRRGPVFTNFLLADEINRAPAKTQAALLEVMQEQQVTIEGKTLTLPPPFMVLATQNPFEHEGTYYLPEAQLDRFLLNVRIDYPSAEQERALLKRIMQAAAPLSNDTGIVSAALDGGALPAIRQTLTEMTVDRRVIDYALSLVRKTREHPMLAQGAGPRAGIALLLCARVKALLAGRDFVIPEDIQALVPAVLRHRVQRSAEAEIDGVSTDSLIEQLLSSVAVPRK